MAVTDDIDESTIAYVGRQLARIGDEVNRSYSSEFDDLEEFEMFLQARRMRRRKSIRRLARIILRGGGINVGLFAVVHLWFGYDPQP